MNIGTWIKHWNHQSFSSDMLLSSCLGLELTSALFDCVLTQFVAARGSNRL